MSLFSFLFKHRPINAGLNTPERIYLQSADTHASRGEEALASGDLEKALLEFKYSVIADSQACREPNARALVHLKGPVLGPLNIKRTTRGQSLVERSVRAQEKGKHAKAVRMLTQAIDLCPIAAVPAFGLRGKSYRVLGRFKEAICDLTIAVAYAPKLAEAYEERSMAYESLGDRESARRDREKVRSILAR